MSVSFVLRRGQTVQRNLLIDAIECDNGVVAATMIRDALGIVSDEVANHVFPKAWPSDREQRACIIGEWLRAEARLSVTPSIAPD
jgi:hypothetical protein